MKQLTSRPSLKSQNKTTAASLSEHRRLHCTAAQSTSYTIFTSSRSACSKSPIPFSRARGSRSSFNDIIPVHSRRFSSETSLAFSCHSHGDLIAQQQMHSLGCCDFSRNCSAPHGRPCCTWSSDYSALPPHRFHEI